MTENLLTVVIPVRNMAGELRGCLEALTADLPSWAGITVVDDGSSDDSADVARGFGAQVLRAPGGGGPYVARQYAAHVATSPDLLFIDARSRPRPGLLQRHRDLLAREGAALSCTAVTVLSGPSFAARVAARQQPFRLSNTIGVPGRPDYFPTCNLGVRRAAFWAVGGFRVMRSGGDADLCWRVQEAGLGGLAADDEVLMDWNPRADLSALTEQWYRYGSGKAALDRLHPRAVASPGRPSRRRRLDVGFVLRRDDRPDGLLVTAFSAGLHVAFLAGLVRGRLTGRRDQAPPFADIGPVGVR